MFDSIGAIYFVDTEGHEWPCFDRDLINYEVQDAFSHAGTFSHWEGRGNGYAYPLTQEQVDACLRYWEEYEPLYAARNMWSRATARRLQRRMNECRYTDYNGAWPTQRRMEQARLASCACA